MEYFFLKQHLIFVLLCVSFLECSLDRQPSFITGVREENEEALTLNCPYKNSDKNSNESESWHAFLNSLFCKFSEHNVEVAERSHSVNHIANFENEDYEIRELIDEVQGTEINENNFERLLNETMQCDAEEYDIKDNMVHGVEIKELSRVLSLTLRDRIKVSCEGTKVYIKGSYITTGDIIDIMYMNRKITDAKCKDLLLSGLTEKFVNIFALNTFIIDNDITHDFAKYHNIVLFSVIAPKWETICESTRRIELKGNDASGTETPLVRNGVDGEPGNPGEPGLNFFGIGSEFVNGMNLEISVSGGDGSRGQDGRKGENGVAGETPMTPSDIECSDKYCVRNEKIRDFKCSKIQCVPYVKELNRHTCRYNMFGKIGTKGENGGKGGKGGKGGYPGDITLIELKSPSEISLLRNSGRDGSDGKGGAGGLGGVKGNDIIVECDIGKYNGFRKWYLKKDKISHETAESGQRGTDGGNIRGMKNPKLAVVINNLDKAKIINEYKSYLREHLHERCYKVMLNYFLNQLETDTNVKNIYNTLGLIDDLQHLEDQYHKINADLNFIPFYESLLNRISEYAYAPKEIGDPGTYKKVLCYVYAAALSAKHNMEENTESDFVTDIFKYLNSVKKEFDKIKDLKNSKYKETLIKKHKDEYKEHIDKKIKEANELISKEITPEVQNTGTELDRQTETLVNEVIRLEKEAEKEHTKLMEQRQQLKNTLILQGMFSVLKIFGAVVSFLGPVGAVAGSVIAIQSTIAESFIIDSTAAHSKVLEVPQGKSELKSINNEIKSIYNHRITCLRNSLDEISLEIIKQPDILSNMSIEISSIKNRLDKLDENKINFKEIQALVNELDTALKSQEENADPKNAQQMTAIKTLNKIVHLSSLFYDSYSKYKNNKAKLDAIGSAIEQNELKLKEFKQYEQKIYNSIIPMLQNIESDVQDIASKLGNETKVALDVTKWRVDGTLRDMMLVMRQFTRGFEVEDNIARCLEKLEEAMHALIRVHQYVQEYQEDQILASYIAEISSVTVTDIIVANNAVLQEELRDAVRNLEITVRSNILLLRYKIAINVFKQFVFPFAHDYFKYLSLPPSLTLSENENNTTLDDLVSKAAAELEKIISKLNEGEFKMHKRVPCFGDGEFRSHTNLKPFSIWKIEKYNDMISKLLSGNEVMIKSDVRSSIVDIDAIKFNDISFNFKSRNETLQTEINEILKGFQITFFHLGNSEYRVAENIYEMMTVTMEFWTMFDTSKSKTQGEYMKGNMTISPYASWKLKMDTLTHFGTTFEDLEKYKGSVDLILEGSGSFINKRNCDYTDLMIDKYYKAIDTVI